jgi:rubrerythrin
MINLCVINGRSGKSMKPIIDAKEARDNVRSGMSAGALMAKFNLSPKGLESLLNKLVAIGALTKDELVRLLPAFMKSAIISAEVNSAAIRASSHVGKEVNAYKAAKDIRSGMNNSYLMKKYGLSPKGLENLFEQLVGAALILPSELQFRLSGLAGIENSVNPGGSEKRKAAAPSLGETVWTCPACSKRQARKYEECPICGVIVAKFKPRPSR